MSQSPCRGCGGPLSEAEERLALCGRCRASGGVAGARPSSDLSRGLMVAGAGVASGEQALGAPGRWLARERAAAREWARGRHGWVRLPLLLWFGWILLRHLREPEYQSLFGGLNLGIHEAGHLLFGWLGEFPGIAGGTVLQLAAPLIAGALFRRQRDWFAVAVALCWLSTNLFSVARYAGDAGAQELPLVSPTSGDPIHDWAYMLGRLGLLRHDTAIAGGFRLLAVAVMLAGLAGGGWLVWHMVRERDVRAPQRA